MTDLPRAEIPGSETWRNLHLDTVVRNGKRKQRMLVEIPVDGNGTFREVEVTVDLIGLFGLAAKRAAENSCERYRGAHGLIRAHVVPAGEEGGGEEET